MARKIAMWCGVLALLSAAAAAAPPGQRPELARSGRYQDYLVGGTTAAAKADTAYVLGGPGALTGKFETGAGQPDWQGWSSRDLSVSDEVHWHVDTFNCANLDLGTPGNHAWWCGRTFPELCDADQEGYGAYWNEQIEWWGTVASSATDVTVHVTADMNHDVEPGYDYVRLAWQRADGTWAEEEEWTGLATDVVVDVTFVIPWTEYLGAGADEVRLAWWVVTDMAYDDIDCSYPSDGAVQIDNIEVSFDQGGGPSLQSSEDCEGPGNDWTGVLGPGVGDFTKIWNRLGETDPCAANFTPQVAFLDDGEVVPGTGGTDCVTHCYDPGLWTTNITGGLLGTDHVLKNQIESPLLDWLPGVWDGAELAFDVWAHLPVGNDPGEAAVTYYWAVRSTASTDPADITAAPWVNDSYVWFGDAPAFLRRTFDISNLVPADARYVQIALGVWDIRDIYTFTGTDPTPGPYFDNVVLRGFEREGPMLTSWERFQAQDAFPERGIVETSVPELNHVRFDAALNRSHVIVDPGDSLVITAAATSLGAVLDGPPRLHYHLEPNTIFDPYRVSGLPLTGSVDGIEVLVAPGVPIPDRFSFDLPDTGFIFPGDVIHYYFEADEYDQGLITTARLPADTTGFDDFGDATVYPVGFTFRALPSLVDFDFGEQPRILLWNDYGSEGGEAAWRTSLANLGFGMGEDFDVFTTKDPEGAHGNGLGGLGPIVVLENYEMILYTSGNARAHTINDGISADDEGDDVWLLDNWLASGDKRFLATGNNVASDMSSFGPATSLGFFLAFRMGVTCAGSDVGPVIGLQDSPSIVPVSPNPVLVQPLNWLAYGGCGRNAVFDDVVPVAAATRLAQFELVGGGAGPWPQSAATLGPIVGDLSMIISLPYDLMQVWDPTKAPVPSAERTRLLEDILIYFGYLGGVPPQRVPSPTLTTATTLAPAQASVWVLPDGTGDGLGECYLLGGARTPATITLTLLDGSAVPVAAYPAEDLWLESTFENLVRCRGGTIADTDTDALGGTTFSLPLRAGGSTVAGELIHVVVAGDRLTMAGIDIRMNSSDITGDLEVNLNDLSLFVGDEHGSYNYRSDFYWDGDIDLSDAILMEEGRQGGSTCE